MKEFNSRSEVPEKYRFDLTDIFPNNQKWEETFQKTKEEIEELPKFQGKLRNGQELSSFLKKYIPLTCTIMDLYVFAMLNHDVDLNEECYIDMFNKIESLNSEFETKTSFFDSELVSFTKEEYESLFQTCPELQNYQKFLDEKYNQKEHTLTTEEEKIISILSETFSSYEHISSSLINQEHDYGKIKLADGSKIAIATNNLGVLKRNKSEKIRKTVNKQFGNTIEQYQNTESALLQNYIKNQINIAKLRNYQSPWDQKLNNIHISNEVFENLKSTAKKRKNAWKNYYRLMKKVLNLKTLHNYDTLLNWNTSAKEYTIEDAEKIVLEALKPLGEDYHKKLERVFQNHYIDYCGYKGKVNGGYSCSTYTQDSRIVLTFKGQFNDILTIAHESGHNVHHQFVNESNEPQYRHTSTFVAEVASLTNEFLVNQYMVDHGITKEEKLIGLEHSIKTFQNNFFGAVREGELEQKMYEHAMAGNTITASYLNQLTLDSFKEYQDNIVKDDGYSKLSWITRSHYYMNFYLYSYAICVVIAASLASKIINQENGILSAYKEFLKCGSDMYPEEIYQKLGIDLKDSKVFESGIDYFESLLNKYEELYEVGEKNE